MRAIALLLAVGVAGVVAADHRTPVKGISLPQGCRDRACARERSSAVGFTETIYQPYDVLFATTGAECACQNVAAGSGGEFVYDVRDSGAYCTKGNTLTGIATGNVVLCPNDTVRVMSGGDGGAGFLSELGMHNFMAGKTALADWTAYALVLDPPVVSTPDAGPCPDGTTTASRISTPANATSPSQYSLVEIDGCAGGGAYGSLSFYVRGYAADGGNDIYMGGTYRHFNYSVNSWTRFQAEAVKMNDQYVDIGNRGYDLGLTEPASDYFVCMPQCETSDHATSWHPNNRDMDRVQAKVTVPTASAININATVLPSGGFNALNVYSSSTWLGVRYSDTERIQIAGAGVDAGGLAGKSEYAGTFVGIPTDGGILGYLRPYTSADIGMGWASYGPRFGDTPYSGVSYACAVGRCEDAGLAERSLTSRGADEEIVEFGGFAGNVDWVFQPDAILKNVHLRSAATKIVFAYGDSIVGGQKPMEAFRNLMWVKRGPEVSWESLAVSGYTIEQCFTDWMATIARLKARPGHNEQIWMLVQCGTNSLPDADAGSLTNYLFQMYEAGRDAGVHVVGSTITPRGDYCDTLLEANQRIRAYGAQNHFTIAETFYSPLWSGVSCFQNDTYYLEGVHPNDAGNIVMWNQWDSVAGW